MTRLVRVFYWAKYEEIHSNRNKKRRRNLRRHDGN
nr:MAG TPA: hypothetical protein [Caudoviricetes sp.]